MNARAAALVAGLAAAAWIASRDLASIPIPTVYSGYQPADPLVAQLIEPVLRAPWIGSVGWLFAASLALCLASEAWLLSILYGASAPAAAAAAIAMIATTPWTDSVRHGGALPIALAFSWLAWLFLAGRRSGLTFTVAGLSSWMIAIATSWLAILCMPMVLAALTIGELRRRVRAGLMVGGLLVGAAGLALYCARVAALTTALTANGIPPVSSIDVLVQVFDPVHGSMTSNAADLGAPSLLVIVLAALGIVGATRHLPRPTRQRMKQACALGLGGCLRPAERGQEIQSGSEAEPFRDSFLNFLRRSFVAKRRWRGGVVLSALLGGAIAMVWPFWRVAVCHLVLWLATPFVAVGITMLARAVAPRRQAIATVTAGAVLCGVVIGDRVTFLAAPHNSPAEPLAPAVVSITTDAGLLVVEDLDVDAAIVASIGVRESGWRVAQDGAYVRELFDAGRTIIAGAVGRRHLELAGLRFEALDPDGDVAAFRLSRVAGQLRCAVVRTDRWSLLPGLEYTGRLGVEIPGGLGGNMTLVVGDDDRPPLVVANARGDVQNVNVEPLLTAPSADAPPPDYWFDGGDPARAPSAVVRVRLPAHPIASSLLDVALGRRAPRVLARLVGFDESTRGRVCASPLAAAEFWADANAPREVAVPLSSVTMLTAGWYGIEGAASAEHARWTDRVAVALIPSAVRAPVRVALDAAPAATQAGEMPTLALRVNGVAQLTHVMREGTQRYEWQIPAPTWLAGTNELVFSVSQALRPIDVGGQDPRVLGMKVTRLALMRID